MIDHFLRPASPPSERRALVFGYGATGHACAQALLAEGWKVVGVARSRAWADAAREAGVDLLQGDITRPEEALPVDPSAFHAALVCAATKPTDARRDPWGLYVEGHSALAAWLEAAHRRAARPARVLVCGNTSVYGPGSVLADGTIDESSPLDPQERARHAAMARIGASGSYTVASEDVWRASGLPWLILRIPGIVKPGSDAMERLVAREDYQPPPTDRTYQTIRLDALARVVARLADRGVPGRVYNATPPRVTSLVRRSRLAAERVGRQLDWPPEAPLDRHALIRARALEELGIVLTEADGEATPAPTS